MRQLQHPQCITSLRTGPWTMADGQDKLLCMNFDCFWVSWRALKAMDFLLGIAFIHHHHTSTSLFKSTLILLFLAPRL